MKLGFCIKKIDISMQKIDRSYLDIFRIVIIDYLNKNKLGKVRFFYSTFLLANISLEVVLEMVFSFVCKVNI